ncbi:MAG: amino acid adenylation domain-containing protein [Gemmatimonadales bacterium]
MSRSNPAGVPSMRTSLGDTLEIARRSGTGPAPLSFAQELLWLVDQASPGLSAWNLPRVYRLRGALDDSALQYALDGLVARHEALRTVFTGPEGAPRQIVQPASPVPLERADITAMSLDQRDAELKRLVIASARYNFELSRDRLFRTLLIHVAVQDHVLCLNSPHLVFDGWSKAIMMRELSALYQAAHRGVPASLPPLPIQFADYATWERGEVHARALAAPLAYWREQLAGPLPTLALPLDRPRPAVRGFERGQFDLVLPPALVEAMVAFARDQGATPYMTLMAAYVVLLHRYTGQNDIIVGSPSAGRTLSEIEGLIGYFVNTLVLRHRVDGRLTFAELLVQVRDTALNAYEHQELPFEKLVLELQKDRQLSHAPLFQTVLTMEDTVPATLHFDGLDVEMVDSELGATKFDLTVMVAQQSDGLRLALWYRLDLHLPATAERMLRHFQAILEAVIRDPTCRIGDLPLLTDAEMREILADSTGPAGRDGPDPVHRQIAAVARHSPDVVALGCETGTLSYGELDRRANQVANRLHALAIPPGTRIGLCAERSIDAVVGLLGILKAGSAYVPLPPDLPAKRLALQAAEARIGMALTTAANRDRVPDGVRVLVLDEPTDAIGSELATDVAVAPDDLAYVLFTSGSTGVPKGVAITHRNLAHYAAAIGARLALDTAASGAGTPLAFGMVSTLGADLGHTVLFPSLMTGGTLHLIPPAVATDAARFGEYVLAHPIDVLKITPSHLSALLSGPREDAVLPRRWLVVGGEPCPWSLAERVLRAGACRILNHYGPTETTVGCCTFEVTAESIQANRDAAALTVPIGRPLPNVTAYVLDGDAHLVPPGVAGELWVGGDGVARGYLDRPDLTADRFRTDPFRGNGTERIYRTGDRVRRLRTGELEFLGRVDQQVKLRGYRVELGEVEQVVALHPGVAEVVATIHTASELDSEATLIAYVVPRAAGYAAAHAERASAASVKTFAGERLPEYMVPSVVMLLDKLPLGANGKLDRSALPLPAVGNPDEQFVAPQLPTEVAVAKIWAEVLKRDRIGLHDNFLALGGHSLLAIRVLGRISKHLGVRLPLRALFEAPTVAELAHRIGAGRAADTAELQQSLAAIEQMSDDQVVRALGEGAAGGDRG